MGMLTGSVREGIVAKTGTLRQMQEAKRLKRQKRKKGRKKK